MTIKKHLWITTSTSKCHYVEKTGVAASFRHGGQIWKVSKNTLVFTIEEKIEEI